MRKALTYVLIVVATLSCNDKRSLVYVGGVPLRVEIADTPDERSKGLSKRKRISGGMLFIFEKEDRYPFWMKETYIPLSIAFIDRKGVIIKLQDMDPEYKNRMYFTSEPILYALEVKMGWFDKHGVTVGDTLIIQR